MQIFPALYHLISLLLLLHSLSTICMINILQSLFENSIKYSHMIFRPSRHILLQHQTQHRFHLRLQLQESFGCLLYYQDPSRFQKLFPVLIPEEIQSGVEI